MSQADVGDGRIGLIGMDEVGWAGPCRGPSGVLR